MSNEFATYGKLVNNKIYFTQTIFMKKSFVKGAIILGLGSIICKLIGAIFRLPLTYLVDTEGIGMYQLVFPVFALFLVCSTSGIPVSISKIISKEYAKENYINVKTIFSCAKRLMIFLGLFFSLITCLLSFVFASIQGNSNLYICYLILAPSIFICSIISCFRGYFQGFEIMKYSAISQILEQLFKLVFSLLFAYILLPFGILYGVCGAFLGLSVSELFALVYLIIIYKRKKINLKETNSEKIYTRKESYKLIVKEALPITLSAMIIPIASVIDSLIIVKLLSNANFDFALSSKVYGLESGVVASLINLPSVIAVSIGVSLMPSLSSSYALKNTKDIEFKSKLAIKIVWYFILPCILIYSFFPQEICRFLYGNLNEENFNGLLFAGIMLRLSSVSMIYIALTQILTTILQAVNESYFSFYVLLFASILKVGLTIILVLVKSLNIYGLIIADTVFFGLVTIVSLIKLKKKIDLKFNFKEIVFVPILSLSFMSVIMFIFKIFLSINYSRLLLLVSILSAFLVYLIFVVIFKGFDLKELKNTKIMKFIKRKKY